jgi:hypothetical protein
VAEDTGIGQLSGNVECRRLTRRLLLAALLIGALLRLLAVLAGDIGTSDGMIRLSYAVEWQQRPGWQGLTGVWPPLHWYLLGLLLNLWYQPVLLAKLLGFAAGLASIGVLYLAARPAFGGVVAALAALLLALTWTHIRLTSSYWVELPYLLVSLLGVWGCQRAAVSRRAGPALGAGAALALALLLRHEALLAIGLSGAWLALTTRSARLLVAFAALPLLAAGWSFLEPWLNGSSYLAYAASVSAQKASENVVSGVDVKESLRQWAIMAVSVPSLVVLLPGLVQLWLERRRAWRDLFAWLFLAQAGLYLGMSVLSGWRPQLRYLLLYFVPLYPYAARAWLWLAGRWPGRPVLAALLAATVLVQGAAWWAGRGEGGLAGWLPLEFQTSSQRALDGWAADLARPGQPNLKVVPITPSSFGPASAWNFSHSWLVVGAPPDRLNEPEVYVPMQPGVARGELPASVVGADVVVIDPAASFYPAVSGALREHFPNLVQRQLHPNVELFLLTAQARLN